MFWSGSKALLLLLKVGDPEFPALAVLPSCQHLASSRSASQAATPPSPKTGVALCRALVPLLESRFCLLSVRGPAGWQRALSGSGVLHSEPEVSGTLCPRVVGPRMAGAAFAGLGWRKALARTGLLTSGDAWLRDSARAAAEQRLSTKGAQQTLAKTLRTAESNKKSSTLWDRKCFTAQEDARGSRPHPWQSHLNPGGGGECPDPSPKPMGDSSSALSSPTHTSSPPSHSKPRGGRSTAWPLTRAGAGQYLAHGLGPRGEPHMQVLRSDSSSPKLWMIDAGLFSQDCSRPSCEPSQLPGRNRMHPTARSLLGRLSCCSWGQAGRKGGQCRPQPPTELWGDAQSGLCSVTFRALLRFLLQERLTRLHRTFLVRILHTLCSLSALEKATRRGRGSSPSHQHITTHPMAVTQAGRVKIHGQPDFSFQGPSHNWV